MVGDIGKIRDSILLMVVSLSWARHSSTLSSCLLGWVRYFSFGYHTIFRASILVLGQCCQLHSVSLVCSREVIQLISATILLSLHFMFAFTDLVPCQHHSDHSVSIMIPISCHWWGIHQGLPTIGHFLSTSTHHPGSWIRNTPWHLGACIHQWPVSSLSMIGLHQWTLNEIFCVVFGINSFIHTIQIIL